MGVRADLKDARLLSLRNEVLGAARQLDEAEDRNGAAALRTGLSFVRATATLPIALVAARLLRLKKIARQYEVPQCWMIWNTA